jgi:hypothetical protein
MYGSSDIGIIVAAGAGFAKIKKHCIMRSHHANHGVLKTKITGIACKMRWHLHRLDNSHDTRTCNHTDVRGGRLGLSVFDMRRRSGRRLPDLYRPENDWAISDLMRAGFRREVNATVSDLATGRLRDGRDYGHEIDHKIATIP